MKILIVNPCQSKLPIPPDLIRADTYISIPLAYGLKNKNHTIEFITSKDSFLDGIKQEKINLKALFNILKIDEFKFFPENIKIELTKLFYLEIFEKTRSLIKNKKYDIIHLHSNYFLLEMGIFNEITNIPIVITLHSVLSNQNCLKKLISNFNLKNKYFISISNKQRDFYPFDFFKTVYNGINLNLFPFYSNSEGKNIIFVGRTVKVKGIKEALEVSVKTNIPLKFTGKTDSEISFFNNEVLPLVNKHKNLIKYYKTINRNNISNFYSLGKILLFPIQWEEPFGLVMIESMATGTPIVAFARGSVPEVIKDGETGFIVNPSDDDIRGDWIIKKTGIEGLCEAVERIYSMPEEQYRKMRKACREHVEKNFTVERMVDEYEKVYYEILNKKNNH